MSLDKTCHMFAAHSNVACTHLFMTEYLQTLKISFLRSPPYIFEIIDVLDRSYLLEYDIKISTTFPKKRVRKPQKTKN